MSEGLRISVIIPVLNAADTLVACLNSVVKQNLAPFEIIILDNDSTDETAAIISDFANRHSNIRTAFLKEKGRGRARNACLDLVRGDIVAMIDADCVALDNDWLGSLVAPIISGQAEATMGKEESAVKNYWSLARQRSNNKFLQNCQEGAYIGHIDTKNFAITADLVKSLRFDSRLKTCEDWDLYFRFRTLGKKVLLVEAAKVAHHHDFSARALFQTQFLRGQEMTLIAKKLGLPIRLRDFFTFIPWSLWQVVTQPRFAPFNILADLAWKIGLLAAYKKKNRVRLLEDKIV